MRVLGIIHTTNRTDVTFSFSRGEKDSKLGLEILIIFSNRISQIIAFATGTKIIWNRHAVDEMKGLIRELEKEHINEISRKAIKLSSPALLPATLYVTRKFI